MIIECKFITGNKVGLVIGNNYTRWNKEKQLKFAVADAQKIKEILENKDICGYDEVIYLQDESSKTVLNKIEKTFQRPDIDLVFIYFSGHGKKDTENTLYLLFNDTEEGSLVSSALSFDDISKCIRKSTSRKSVIIVLDCCYSGTAGIRDSDVMEALKIEGSGSGIIVLTSTGSTGSPTAREDENLGHGIFTYYLIEGLEKGYANKDNDGNISVDDLYTYAFGETKKRCSQSPQKKANIEGNLFIGRNLLKIKDKAPYIGKNTGFVIKYHNMLLDKDRKFNFFLLNEEFLAQQRVRSPSDFYDGNQPNWANIAKNEDVHRNLYNEIYSFVKVEKPYQRMGIILGLSGEGKTTLLMRLAWNLAEEGYPVFWNQSPTIGYNCETFPNFELNENLPIILFFDDVDKEVKNLTSLAENLSFLGIHYIILSASRIHEWNYSLSRGNIRSQLGKSLTVKFFKLSSLEKEEIKELLYKLNEADKLSFLKHLLPSEQMDYFVNKLKSDRQLLPAMICLRYGDDIESSFESKVEDVLYKIKSWVDGERLLKSYLLLAVVHQFGYSFPKSLYAKVLEIDERKIKSLIVEHLKGELLQIEDESAEKLCTRHRVISEVVSSLLLERNTLDLCFDQYDIYSSLVYVYGEEIGFSEKSEQCKLFFKIAKKVAKTRDFATVNFIFERMTEFAPENFETWKTWINLIQEKNKVKACQILEKAIRQFPDYIPFYLNWALLEKLRGNIEKSRNILKKGLKIKSTHSRILYSLGILEKDSGNIEEARKYFNRATISDSNDGDIWIRWGNMETDLENYEEAIKLFEQASIKVRNSYKLSSVYSAYGHCLYEYGKNIDAENKFIQSLKLNARNPYAHFFYGQLLEKVGDLNGAYSHYITAQEIIEKKRRDTKLSKYEQSTRSKLRLCIRSVGKKLNGLGTSQ